MRVFLQTDRLTLRRFTEADEGNLFELNSDPEVMRFLNGGRPTPRGLRSGRCQNVRRGGGAAMLPSASPDISTLRITGRAELVSGRTLTALRTMAAGRSRHSRVAAAPVHHRVLERATTAGPGSGSGPGFHRDNDQNFTCVWLESAGP